MSTSINGITIYPKGISQRITMVAVVHTLLSFKEEGDFGEVEIAEGGDSSKQSTLYTQCNWKKTITKSQSRRPSIPPIVISHQKYCSTQTESKNEGRILSESDKSKSYTIPKNVHHSQLFKYSFKRASDSTSMWASEL